MSAVPATTRETSANAASQAAGTADPGASAAPLVVLVADSDASVHEAARAALAGLVVAGRSVALRHARTLDEARGALGGVALVLVEEALGARALLESLRVERRDPTARAIVRRAGDSPSAHADAALIERLDIDALLLPQDAAGAPLRAVARSALWSHADRMAVQMQIEGLGEVAETLSDAPSEAYLAGALRSLVEEIAAHCGTHDYLCAPFLSALASDEPLVIAGGRMAAALRGAAQAEGARALVEEVRDLLVRAEGGVVALPGGRTAFRLDDPGTPWLDGLLVVGSPGPVPPRVRALVRVLGHKLTIARKNLDLARRLAREKEIAREAHADRMALLGRLAASLAHELNTPLGVAVHACSLASEQADAIRADLPGSGPRSEATASSFADLHEALGLVARNVASAAKLVASFKSMAVEQASGRVEEFDPAQVVANAVASLGVLLKPKHQTVRLERVGRPVRLRNDPGLLAQVVNNLVLNAALHGYGGGPGEIVVRHRAPAAGALELEVEDRGAGMDEETVRRVFDPFVTTARHQGGSGLGMAIVWQIVTASYGGTIAADSAPGRGTRFVVRLPTGEPRDVEES